MAGEGVVEQVGPQFGNRPVRPASQGLDVAPNHTVSFDVTLRLAEAQARLLYSLAQPTPGRSVADFVARLPHIRVEYRRDLPPGDIFFWHRPSRAWVVRLPAEADAPEQELQLLRAFKFIIDHAQASWLYDGRWLTGQAQRRIAAEHFAVSALLPIEALTAARHETNDSTALAARFHVPVQLVEQRLADLPLLHHLSTFDHRGTLV